jgi:stress response protein SCP2
MKTKTAKTDITIQLDRLIFLLKEQLFALKKSDFGYFEKLTIQTDSIIGELNTKKIFPKKLQYRQKLQKAEELYNTIRLAVKSQSQQLSEQLKHVHNGRNTLTKYQKPI